jgi:hypothetical protein
VTALGFDPWAVLKTAKQGYPPPNPPKTPNPTPVLGPEHPTPASETRTPALGLGELGALGGVQAPIRELSHPAPAPGLGELGGLGGEGGPQRELQDRAAFLLRAAEDALAALAGPELGPVLQVGQLDHDDAERAALVEYYAEPVAVPPAGPGRFYCFPCGRPVLLRDRTWSEARGWCCATCSPAVARAAR